MGWARYTSRLNRKLQNTCKQKVQRELTLKAYNYHHCCARKQKNVINDEKYRQRRRHPVRTWRRLHFKVFNNLLKIWLITKQSRTADFASSSQFQRRRNTISRPGYCIHLSSCISNLLTILGQLSAFKSDPAVLFFSVVQMYCTGWPKKVVHFSTHHIFCWNPFRFISNGSKDMACWKKYNFLGHPVHACLHRCIAG